MELKKGQNMMEHEAEIYARPARTWFQTEKEKQNAKGKLITYFSDHDSKADGKDASKSAYVSSFPEEKKSFKSKPDEKEKPAVKRGKYDGLSRKLKRRKMAMEEDEADEQVSRNTALAIRNAKKSAQPVKITEALPKKNLGKGKGKDKKKKVARGRVGGGKGSAFDTPGGDREGMRAQKTKVNLDKKGGKKGAKGAKGPRK
jgi:ATP-dependent RNA helicase DDX27